LKSAPQALDAAFGLRAVGRNVGDAELRKSATKLGRLAFPRELFFDRPVVIVTHEDPVLVPIETEGDAVAAQQMAQQVEIPASIFRGKELGNGNLACGVVKEAEEGELWAAIFEPAMKAAIEEEHFALPSAAKTSLAVRRSAPFLGGAETALAEQTAESLPTEGATFHLAKLLAEMMIVETDIAGAGEMQDTVSHTHRKAARARSSATGVCHTPTRQIVALVNIAQAGQLPPRRVVFQIAYDEHRLVTRAELLRHHGYEVVSVVGNEAAKIVLSSPQHCDLFIVGHAAPEQTRKEMVDWLKARYPHVKILALEPQTSTLPKNLRGLIWCH
jgi:hypothetical protein